MNIFFAAMFVWALIGVIDPAKVLKWAEQDPFRQGMLLVAGCFLLLGFATLRSLLKKFLDHAVFPRNDLEELLQEIRSRTGSAVNESELLSWASGRIARFFEAEAIEGQPKGNTVMPLMVSDLHSAEREELERMSVEAVLPLRVSAEEFRYLLLGRRSGGRRYLSEDLEALNRIQTELVEQLDRPPGTGNATPRGTGRAKSIAIADSPSFFIQRAEHVIRNHSTRIARCSPDRAEPRRHLSLFFAD